jgi:pimeloyl-ACP methyl ester carboxylesterase
VLLHAGVADARMWEPNRERLGKGRTLVTLDLRGFGRSPWGTGSFSHVGDVLAVLDGIELLRVALAGASFGGSVALDLALAHPGRVSALVLAAPALGGWDWSPDQRAFGAEEDRLLDAGDVEAAVELNVRRWVDAGRPPGEVDPGMRALVADMQRHAFELALAAFSSEPEPGPEQELEPPAAGRLDEIRCPALVVLGALDVPDMLAIGAHLGAGLAHVRVETLPGVAHLPSLEAPAAFDALVSPFLHEHAA